MNEEIKENCIIIPIVKESGLDKDGKEIKDKDGNISYKREDYQGLLTLLNLYDTRKQGSFMKEGRIYLGLKDKVEKGWAKDSKVLNLTLDEASFLKKFLTELPDKEAKEVRLPEYIMRTLFGMLDILV